MSGLVSPTPGTDPEMRAAERRGAREARREHSAIRRTAAAMMRLAHRGRRYQRAYAAGYADGMSAYAAGYADGVARVRNAKRDVRAAMEFGSDIGWQDDESYYAHDTLSRLADSGDTLFIPDAYAPPHGSNAHSPGSD